MCVNFGCGAASDLGWCSPGFHGLTLFGVSLRVGLGGVELSSLMVRKSDRNLEL